MGDWGTRASRIVGAALLGLLLGCAEGAGVGSEPGGGRCTPGSSIACECPDGGQGAQVCAADGVNYLACECVSATEGDAESEEDDGDGDAAATSSGAESTTAGDAVCGDGSEDPGECDPGDPAYCPEDCSEPIGTTGDPCADAPTFFGLIAGVGSRWEHAGFVGFVAGDAMCTDLGADHACDYDEILLADGKGELAGVAIGTTAWIHRTSDGTLPGGGVTPPGLGGRCVDWTYSTNHLSDGEYIEFTPAGPVYNLDDDTFYDGTATEHTQTDLLQCGGVVRSVMCCHAACM